MVRVWPSVAPGLRTDGGHGVGEGLAGQRGQGRVGAELDVSRNPAVCRVRQAVGETDRAGADDRPSTPATRAAPAVASSPVRFDTTGMAGGCEGQAAGFGTELLQNGVHVRGMESMTHRQPPRTVRPRPAQCAETASTASRSPDTTVDTGEFSPATVTPPARLRHHLTLGRLHRHHRPVITSRPASTAPGQPPDEPHPANETHPTDARQSAHRSNDRTDNPARSPDDSTSRYNAVSTANNAACVYRV